MVQLRGLPLHQKARNHITIANTGIETTLIAGSSFDHERPIASIGRPFFVLERAFPASEKVNNFNTLRHLLALDSGFVSPPSMIKGNRFSGFAFAISRTRFCSPSINKIISSNTIPIVAWRGRADR